ncbi:MAG: peptide ABC transporter substrate-binding protein [Gammaproteobacteria bacterium]
MDRPRGKATVLVRLLAAGVGCALLAACGPEAGPRGEPLRPGVQILHRGNGAEPASLDPHHSVGGPAANIERDLYEGLVSTSPGGAPTSGVAASWEVSPDGLTWTFHLRPNARWSNGDPVTAEDFQFSFRRAVDPSTASDYADILAPVLNARAVTGGRLPPEALGVEALDGNTLRIRLEGPTPFFLELLTHPMTFPVHRESLATHGERFTRPGNLVSNGPFYLAEWVVGSHVKLGRNHNYWDTRNVAIDEVYYYPTANESAELARYRAGELDWTYHVPHQQLGWIQRNLAAEVSTHPRLAVSYLGINVTHAPFADSPELRRALSMAIDRELIVRAVTGGGEIPAYGWVPPMDGYTPQVPEWAAWTRRRQVAKAQMLYSEAGYDPRDAPQVEIAYASGPNSQRLAVAIAAMWKDVLGIQASLRAEEFKVFLQSRSDLATSSVFRSAWAADYRDVYSFASVLHSGSGLSDTGWQNPRYDALLAASLKTGDQARRMELLQEAERLLLEEQPVIPLYYFVTTRLVKPWVRGWEPNLMDIHPSRHFYLVDTGRP